MRGMQNQIYGEYHSIGGITRDHYDRQIYITSLQLRLMMSVMKVAQLLINKPLLDQVFKLAMRCL